MGRSNYSQTEVFNMLESVCEYLPIPRLEWDLVAQCHMAFHPDEEQSVDQLKKKFTKLAKTKMCTGDPTMPPDVSEAKQIRRLIIEKSEGVTGTKEEAFALEDVVNNDKLEEDEGNGNFLEEEAPAVDAGVEGNAGEVDDAIVAI